MPIRRLSNYLLINHRVILLHLFLGETFSVEVDFVVFEAVDFFVAIFSKFFDLFLK